MKTLKDYEYYRTDLGVLYNADCLEILPLIEDKVDLVLTDPPYGIDQMTYRKNKSRAKLCKTKNYGEYEWDKQIIKGLEKHLEKYKRIIVFGGQCYNFKSNYGWIVWDKKTGSNNFSDCEIAYTNFLTAVRLYEYKWNGMLQEFMGRKKQIREHPNEKPVILFKWILEDNTEKGDLILDCCAGSGITGEACEMLGLRWILIEKEKNNCEIAKKRIKGEADQLKFF